MKWHKCILTKHFDCTILFTSWVIFMAYRREANLSFSFHNSLTNTLILWRFSITLHSMSMSWPLLEVNKILHRIFLSSYSRAALTFPPHARRLIECGAYSGAALIRVNTVFFFLVKSSVNSTWKFKLISMIALVPARVGEMLDNTEDNYY